VNRSRIDHASQSASRVPRCGKEKASILAFAAIVASRVFGGLTQDQLGRFQQQLSSADAKVRLAALNELESTNLTTVGNDIVPLLPKALRDPDQDVRVNAAGSLAAIALTTAPKFRDLSADKTDLRSASRLRPLTSVLQPSPSSFTELRRDRRLRLGRPVTARLGPFDVNAGRGRIFGSSFRECPCGKRRGVRSGMAPSVWVRESDDRRRCGRSKESQGVGCSCLSIKHQACGRRRGILLRSEAGRRKSDATTGRATEELKMVSRSWRSRILP
jgi:hypothetical protein